MAAMQSPELVDRIRTSAVQAMGRRHPASTPHHYSDSVFCFRETSTSELRETLYEPALCLILQGSKRTSIDGRVLEMSAGDTVLISHHVPVQAQITGASQACPYIALILRLDMSIIRDLYQEIRTVTELMGTDYAVVSEGADDALLETIARLLSVLSNPLEARLLGASVYRETHLRILQAPHGGMLRRLASGDSVARGVARAIKLLRERYSESVSVGAVATEAGMSESSLYQRFREITGTTPNQYLKSLRLQEARSFLSLKGFTVAETAYAVGYKSPSHFSRDYAKHFGAPPKTARAALA